MIADLKPYPAYKDSGVEWLGEVPEGWEVRRLKHASEPLVNGIWGSDPDGINDIACIRVADFDRERLVTKTPTPTIRAVTVAERRRRLLRRGDLLLEKSGGGDQQPVGVVVEHTSDTPAVSSNFVARMRPRSEFVGRYLAYLHCVLYARRVNVRSVRQTTGIQNLDGREYLGERVPLAATSEQKAIVHFLDHIDSRIHRLIMASEQLIALLKEERQAIIHQIVTSGLDPRAQLKPSGVEWLGDVPQDWDIIPLRLRYSVKLGKMLDAKRITGTSLMPYLRNTDVQWGRINTEDLPEMDISPEEQDRYTVRTGDLLVCEGGEVGRAAIWEQSQVMGYQKALHRLRPVDGDRDRPRFLFYVLRAIADLGLFKADGSESTIAHLTAEKLRRLRVPFPPVHEQKAIVRQLDRELEQRETVAAAAHSEINLLREYRTRLISDVVTGKLDVREAAENLPEDPDAEDPALDERLEEVAAG